MYDITDKNSFNCLRNWTKQVEQNVQTKAIKIIVGNKINGEKREVTEEEGKQLADEFSYPYIETCTETNQNINEVFEYLIRKNIGLEINSNSIYIGSPKKKNNNKCAQ